MSTLRERERSEGTKGTASTATIYRARRLADWPDLAPTRDRGQWAEVRGRVELWVSTFMVITSQTLSFFFLLFCFFVLGYITKSTVMICPMLKSVIFFFSLLACPPCRSRISAMSEKRKKKKTPLGHRSPVSHTSIRVWHMLDTGTSPKMACQCNLGVAWFYVLMFIIWSTWFCIRIRDWDIIKNK